MENINPVKIILRAENIPHSVFQNDSKYTVIYKFLPPCSFGIVRPSQQDVTMTGRYYCMQVSYVLQRSVGLCTNIHHNCKLGSAKEHLNTASSLGPILTFSVTPSANSAITTGVKTSGGKSATRKQT